LTRILTSQIATITELREPQKVLARAGGKPVAIMKNSRCVGYLVPVEAVLADEPRVATLEEVRAHLAATRAKVQPVLDYLRDK